MYKNIIYITSLLFVIYLRVDIAEKIRYISTERPRITYYNRQYFSYVNISARRFSRKNPFYYVDIHSNSLIYMDDNVTMNFYFSQDIGNGHYRTLFEIHRKWCNFISMDTIIGTAMRQGKYKAPCPHPPGDYHMYNMSIPVENIPRSLPYFKGRIHCNISHTLANEAILSAFIDVEMKDFKKH